MIRLHDEELLPTVPVFPGERTASASLLTALAANIMNQLFSSVWM